MKIITHEQAENNNLYKADDYIITNNATDLGKGYSYLNILNGFFMKGKEIIELTPLENKVLQCLAINDGLVTYEVLFDFIWGRQNVSMERLRNIIRSIRIRSYHEIIINASNQGYILGARK